MSTSTFGTCLRCYRQLIPSAAWRRLTQLERQAMKALGRNRAARRDLCVTCWAYLNAHGELERYTTQTGSATAPGACARCGVRGLLHGALCRDCTDVTYDLNEREAWA